MQREQRRPGHGAELLARRTAPRARALTSNAHSMRCSAGPKQRLEAALAELTAFLGIHAHASHFVEQVRTSRDEVRRGDAGGLRRFLSLHGGMGSLNDTSPAVASSAAGEREADCLQARFDALDRERGRSRPSCCGSTSGASDRFIPAHASLSS